MRDRTVTDCFTLPANGKASRRNARRKPPVVRSPRTRSIRSAWLTQSEKGQSTYDFMDIVEMLLLLTEISSREVNDRFHRPRRFDRRAAPRCPKNKGVMFVPKSSRGARAYRPGAAQSIADSRVDGRPLHPVFFRYRMDIRNEILRPPHGKRLTTRGQFVATGTALAIGAASLSPCSPIPDPYAAAVRRTWRPFNEAISERRALQHELIRYATLAPSSHNTQCWRFELRRDRIAIEPDWSRRCPAVDPDDHHLFVSLGCATENLMQAARAHGFRSEAQFDAAGGGAVAVALASARPDASTLHKAIPSRQCTGAEYDGRPLTRNELHALEAVGRGDGVRVVLLTARTYA